MAKLIFRHDLQLVAFAYKIYYAKQKLVDVKYTVCKEK